MGTNGGFDAPAYFDSGWSPLGYGRRIVVGGSLGTGRAFVLWFAASSPGEKQFVGYGTLVGTGPSGPGAGRALVGAFASPDLFEFVVVDGGAFCFLEAQLDAGSHRSLYEA